MPIAPAGQSLHATNTGRQNGAESRHSYGGSTVGQPLCLARHNSLTDTPLRSSTHNRHCKGIRVDGFTKVPESGVPLRAHRGGCRDFHCAWQASASLGEKWRRSRCKLVLRVESEGRLIAVHLDRSEPAVWRREPYFRAIRPGRQRRQQQPAGDRLGNRVICDLPNKEVEDGIMNPGII